MRQYESLRSEINRELVRVLASGVFIQGENVKSFEREFAAYIGVKHAISVNSGTDALRVALEAVHINSGQTITVAHTFASTAYAVVQNGGRPVFVDVDPAMYTIDPASVEKSVTRETKAILPVHIYGQSADMEQLIEIAEKHGLALVEDSAQAHGAEFAGRRTGSFGIAGCFSFYPSKNLGAYGDGGMIVTNDGRVAERARMLREYGQTAKYRHIMLGYNSRLDELQAAILRVKLRHLDTWNEKRRKHAKLYNELLGKTKGIVLPIEGENRKHVYHIYAIRNSARNRLREFLATNGILTGIHYPVPLHKQIVFDRMLGSSVRLKTTEKIAKEVLALPMFPELTEEEIEFVSDEIKRFVSHEE